MIKFLENALARREYPDTEIRPLYEMTTRGTLVQRVNRRGAVLGNVLLVTGSYVSGSAGDPDSVKKVYAHELERDKEQYKIVGDRLDYDPELTVVKIGYIDYMDPANAEFFKPLGNTDF